MVVYKASGVTLQNFSTCNFLGSNAGGDSVWFDGGGATGKQEIGSWWGEYLSSTSTYWGGTEQALRRVRHLRVEHLRPGLLHATPTRTTCPTPATTSAPARTATRRSTTATAEGNDLGYSGSNSGGHVVIENSEFNNNEEGVATQSQNNDDAPSPAGRELPRTAPKTRRPPPGAQRKNICWVMIHNRVIDNNNGATPTSDGAPGLLGTGMTIAGGRNDLVVGNTFSGNEAWGILLLPYPGIEERRRRRSRPKTTARAGSDRRTAKATRVRLRSVRERDRGQHVRSTTAATGTRPTATSAKWPTPTPAR